MHGSLVRGHSRNATRPRSGGALLPWAAAAAFIGAEVVMLSSVPSAQRMLAEVLLAFAACAVLAAYSALTRRGQARPVRSTLIAVHDDTAANRAAVRGAEGPQQHAPGRDEPDEPSARMAQACRLARLGVPAIWIADHCDLPLGLAELVVAEALAPGDPTPGA